MPNRILYEGILTSDAVQGLSDPAQLLFYKLINVHDDHGRFDARPAIVRSRCYPLATEAVKEQDITAWLAELERVKLVSLYEVAGKPYGAFSLIDEPRAKGSKFPEPPQSAGICQHLRADARTCSQMRPYSYSYSYPKSESYPNPKRLTAAEMESDGVGGSGVKSKAQLQAEAAVKRFRGGAA